MALANTKIRSEYRRRPEQKQARVASPVGGLNFLNSTMDFPADDAYVLDNIFPRPFGCEIRKGWRNWVPAANKFPAAVKTIMTYAGATKAAGRIFASYDQNPSKVYDVTTQNAAPVLSLTPSTNSDHPGEWYHSNFVTQGGNFLLAVSAGAGYYSYNAGTWTEHVDGTVAGEIDWPIGYGSLTTTKNIAFVWVWKNRVWFLMKDSAIAFYLPVGQISGLAAAFDFGQQIDLGGSLLWGSDWTYDSGSGIDDALILASTEGQILVYEGIDPANAATFQLKGRWFAGRFPVGRRNFCEHGGQVEFLCEYGMISISDLVSGKLHTSGLAGTLGSKVNPRLSRQLSENLDKEYWFLLPYPTDEMLICGTPLSDNMGLHQTLCMNSLSNAWCTFSGLDILSADVFQGQFIYGTSDGLVIQGFYGFQDGLSADGSVKGDAVTGRLQGAFNDYGSPNMNKRMLRVKVYGVSNSDPSFFARFQPEYVLNVPIDAPAPRQGIYPLWDDAIWDEAIWAEGDGSFHRWFGVNGFGKKMSLQLAIRGAGNVVYTDHEALFEEGIGL